MKRTIRNIIYGAVMGLALGLLAACAGTSPATPTALANDTPRVLAVETFLADIAQNVAGDRLKVESLIPIGVDPHAFRAHAAGRGTDQPEPGVDCQRSRF